MFQGFHNLSGFLHHFVLAKLVTSSIRVETQDNETWIFNRLNRVGQAMIICKIVNEDKSASLITSFRQMLFLEK